MRKLVLGTFLMLAVAAQPAAATMNTQAAEAGYALGAAAADLLYVPAKTVVAVGGLAAGAVTGFLTLGNTRAAYALWVPAATGTYVLTPGHLDGTRPIEFFGADYADRPSRNLSTDRTLTYDAMYVP